MNWADFTVLIIIAIFTFIGLKNGFLYSVFRLLSYILSVIFAVKFYPVLSGILQKTVIFDSVKMSVIRGLMKQQGQAISNAKETAAQSVVEGLKLPGFLKDSILEHIQKSNILDFSGIINAVGSEIASLVMNVLSLIIIYALIRFGLVFAKVIIKTIARVPVFRQLDKTGGIVLGAVEGILAVYIICAVLVLFSAFPKFSSSIDEIEKSLFAGHFYENNFIVSWISPDHIDQN
ncbi:CvpA family protein [Ruminiclostridium papyrosolvens]|uniref:Colicin V production protein n=1 Tax=Ruminiclostridium papyrosolvens C7 TaxID=1330534 RepID=U4R6W4_9FIRM|nr:CvpA family protein [Ruminiclostridium papyrosolvens]EPR13727.1 Colicin V production protein [Ruminiclostridium papyrosolvens C7]